MKTSLPSIAFVLTLASTMDAMALQFCGQGGLAVFNSNNVYECVVTKNTCETDALLSQGWMPTANGECGNAQPSLFCGMGGTEMQHPQDARWTLSTTNTCETDVLKARGWTQAQ